MSEHPTNFCHLHGELAISYNGHVIKKERDMDHLSGAVLTKDGKVFTRDNRKSCWEAIYTPAVFLFYDNKSHVAYKVDSCEKCIKKVEPHGRILDCTDQVIYEIKDQKWCPVCDLTDTKVGQTLVFTQNVGACATGINFQVQGSNPSVLSFSQIPASAVNFVAETVDIEAVPPGSSLTLLYQTDLCGKCTIVAQIFIREVDEPRVSAQCAADISPTGVTLNAFIICQSPVDALMVQPTGANAFLIDGWETNYSVPVAQMALNGWHVPETADYDFSLILSYLTDGIVDNSSESDNFILTQTRGTAIAIIGRVSVGYDFDGVDYHLATRGQALFNKGLRLQQGDVIQVYLVSKFAPGQAGYILDPVGASLHAEEVGCTASAPFPTV